MCSYKAGIRLKRLYRLDLYYRNRNQIYRSAAYGRPHAAVIAI